MITPRFPLRSALALLAVLLASLAPRLSAQVGTSATTINPTLSSGTLTVANNATLILNGPHVQATAGTVRNTLTSGIALSGNSISTGASLTRLGSGSLVLTAGTVSTGVTLSAGSISTLNTNGSSLSFGGVFGGTLNLGNTYDGTLNLGNSSGSTVLTSGTVVTGAGTLVLAAGSYTGGTLVLTTPAGASEIRTGTITLVKTGNPDLVLPVQFSGGILSATVNGSLVTLSSASTLPLVDSTGTLTGTADQVLSLQGTSVFTAGAVLAAQDFGIVASTGDVATSTTVTASNAQAVVRGSYAPPAGAPEARYRVEYGTDPTLASPTLHRLDFTATNTLPGPGGVPKRVFATVLDWLQPSTTYYFRTKIVQPSADGTEEEIKYGRLASFTTGPMIENGPFWLTGDSLTLTAEDVRRPVGGLFGTNLSVSASILYPPGILAITPSSFGTTTATGERLTYTPGAGFGNEDTFRVKLGYAQVPLPVPGFGPVSGTLAYLVNVKVRRATSPIVTTDPAQVGSNTYALLKATYSANGPEPITISFEYGPTAAYGMTVPASRGLLTLNGSVTSGSATALLPDLLPGKLYHYCAKITTGLGTAYGVDRIFQMPTLATASRVVSNGEAVTFDATTRGLEPQTTSTLLTTIYPTVTVFQPVVLQPSTTTGLVISTTPGLGVPVPVNVGPNLGPITRSRISVSTGTLQLNQATNSEAGAIIIDGIVYRSGYLQPASNGNSANQIVIANPSIPFPIFTGGRRVSRLFGASHGTLTTDGTHITYTPDATFAGEDTIEYELASAEAFNQVIGTLPFLPPKVPFRVQAKVTTSERSATVTTSGNPALKFSTAPNGGAFSGQGVVDGAWVRGLVGPDGSLKLRLGEQLAILPRPIAHIGAPNGSAVLVTLAPGSEVTAASDVVLLHGLKDSVLAIAAREGDELANAPGVRVKSFGAIDGGGSVTFFLATLRGPGVTARNDLALCAAPHAGPPRLLLREGQDVTGFEVASFATLVGAPGTLAEGRWRTGDDSIGVRVSYADKTQGIYSIPANATSPSQWTSLAPFGAGQFLRGDGPTGGPLSSLQFAGYGLPGCGTGTAAVRVNLGLDPGIVTAQNNAALLFQNRLILRKGDSASVSTTPSLTDPFFADFADPIGGAADRFAFAATLGGTGVDAGNRSSLWFVTEADQADPALHLIARAGSLAPGGGTFTSFTSLVLPNAPGRGPVFTATLALQDGLTVRTNSGIWYVDGAGITRRLLRAGAPLSLHNGPRTIASFIALTPAPGSIGAAQGYDEEGSVTIFATFTDRSTAVLTLPLP